MKLLDNLNPQSKTYITGIIFSIIALFIVTAVAFLFLISDKLDVVMTQAAGITYTYFIQIADRILALLIVFVIFPLTIYQLLSKNKSKIDNLISIFSILLMTLLIGIFWGGQYHFLQKYRDGELKGSKMFAVPTIETKIFDKIIK